MTTASSVRQDDPPLAEGWRLLSDAQAYARGRWRGTAAGAPIEVIDPATGAVIGSVPSLSVEQARAWFNSMWDNISYEFPA